jgi:hypothetical protein
MDAAQIEGDHLWREFLGAVSDQFSMGRSLSQRMILFQNLLQTVAQQLDAVAQSTLCATTPFPPQRFIARELLPASVPPARMKTKISIESERPTTLHTDSLTDIREFSVLPLSRRSGYFSSHDATVGGIGKRVSDYKRIAANLFNLVVGEIRGVACRNDLLYQGGVNGLFQQQSVRVVVL